ncbi:Golgi-to-ER vesicle coat component, partial [Ascosphaera acerosa]
MSLDLQSVNAVLIMSTQDSSRVFAKYYAPPHMPITSTAPTGAASAGTGAGAGATGPAASGPTYTPPYATVKEQKAFEKGLLEKTNKSTSEIILYDNRVVVYKAEGDVMLYVVESKGDRPQPEALTKKYSRSPSAASL